MARAKAKFNAALIKLLLQICDNRSDSVNLVFSKDSFSWKGRDDANGVRFLYKVKSQDLEEYRCESEVSVDIKIDEIVDRLGLLEEEDFIWIRTDADSTDFKLRNSSHSIRLVVKADKPNAKFEDFEALDVEKRRAAHVEMSSIDLKKVCSHLSEDAKVKITEEWVNFNEITGKGKVKIGVGNVVIKMEGDGVGIEWNMVWLQHLAAMLHDLTEMVDIYAIFHGTADDDGGDMCADDDAGDTWAVGAGGADDDGGDTWTVGVGGGTSFMEETGDGSDPVYIIESPASYDSESSQREMHYGDTSPSGSERSNQSQAGSESTDGGLEPIEEDSTEAQSAIAVLVCTIFKGTFQLEMF